MGDAELSRVFFASGKTVPPTKRASGLAPLLPAFTAMLKKRGVTKGMAYRAYALQCPGGYKISAFIERLNLCMSIGRPSMKMEHLAGDKMFVDFTGKKLRLAPQSLAGRSVIFNFLNAEPADAVQSLALVDTSANPFIYNLASKWGLSCAYFDTLPSYLIGA